ncbi:MAG: PorP/SprF family type IX secretion system membrane protein [Bacteroidia bacterium]|nr:PorP/SprF family type IX secretion system membrane protein [Bacteroidia bacterium]
MSILVFFLLSIRLFGQDIHFSQFYSTPLFLNPANTGDCDGTIRFANLYRSQWKSIGQSYSTLSLSVDKPMNSKFGGGLLVLYDQSGLVGLSAVKFYISGSYKKIFSNNYLRMGVQVGLVHKYFDPGKATYPDQFDMSSGYYNPGLPNYEANMGETMTYLDANAGILWKIKIGNIIPELGASFQHLNMPVESFGGNSNRLPIRTNLHTSIRINTYGNFSLVPSAIYSYSAGTNELLSGFMANFGIVSPSLHTTSFSAGAFYRFGINRNYDAIVACAGIDFAKLKFGLSYDYTVSEVQTISKNQGAFEISIIYSNIAYLFNLNTVPCERY